MKSLHELTDDRLQAIVDEKHPCSVFAKDILNDRKAASAAAPLPKSIRFKKVFETYWTIERVVVNHWTMSVEREKFFEVYVDGDKVRQSNAVIPDSISFSQLQSFAGRKTRVTIEVIE